MQFIESVHHFEGNEDMHEGGIFTVPVLGSDRVARFQWRGGEEVEDFLKRHGIDGSLAGYDSFKISSSLDEDQFISSLTRVLEIEFHFYTVRDLDGKRWFLVCNDILSWEDIDEVFCIPNHTYNILELCRHFLVFQENSITRG